MIKNFSADYVLPVSGEPIKNGTVAVSPNGEIVGIYENDNTEIKDKPLEKLEGIIVPGFVNAHCHLELSHLHGILPKQQGLVPFIKKVISQRKADENIIYDAMLKADKAMQENGIVAVGDISNTGLSGSIKKESPIFYHTFIELLCFEPQKAKDIFRDGLALKEEFAPMRASIAPHAPYSVCKDIFSYLRHFCDEGSNLFSIHNQETEEENKFYRYKTGQFVDLYKDLKLDIDFFKPHARNSLQSIIPLLPAKQKILLVHNTYTSLKDIYFVRRFGRDIHWCFCPNANLHIENRLPKLELFLHHGFNIALGTDSLASNDHLCILSELKTLSKHFPSVPFTETIAWATLKGAEYLGIDKKYGSIEKGKKPGLNLITAVDGLDLTAESKVKKLI